MTNLDRYNKAFVESFNIEKDELDGLKYQDIEAWDSVGHMQLMAELEDEFDVEEVEVSNDQEGLLAYLEDAVEVEWEDVEMDELV